MFAGVNTPIMKLGMNFCLNRDTKLYHIIEPVFDKKLLTATYLKCLNPKEFLSINPKFSEDFSKLLFIGVKESFISHTTNFQLSYLNWPPVEGIESTLVIDKFKRYPNLPSD